jgi:hypothetical protein
LLFRQFYPINIFIVVSSLLFANYPASVLAQNIENIHLEPAPAWVIQYETGPLDDVPTDEVSNGLHYHMVDNQIQVSQSGERVSYSRYVETIINQSGLETSSQLNFRFDPSYQKLVLHSLFILRDGQRLDQLQSAKKSILNTESELKRQIYNGSLTLNVLISDLQVGDTLDYSYTRFGANPVYRDSFSYQRNINWGMPLNIQHLRILWGKSNPLFVTPINANPEVLQNQLGDYTEYQISIYKAEVQDTPTQMPNWYDPYSSIYFSESKTWNDVVAWAEPWYIFDAHSSVKDVAQTIKREYSEESEQIVAALKYTQEQIRYVGLEMGTNSHVPTAPEETLKLKYGDCKDKASLLIAILAELGIEAFPALVDTEYTKLLSKMPPAANLFNHVLVSLRYQDQQFWLDPTLINQHGDLANIYQPDYGLALVLKSGEQGLTSMAGLTAGTYSHTTEKYSIPEKHEDVVKLLVTTHYSGKDTLEILDRIEQDGKNKVADSYEVYYQRAYPKLESTSPMLLDVDGTQGIVSINETYDITDFWKMGDEHYEVDYYPTDIRDAVFKPKQAQRNAPLSIKYPNNIQNHFEIKFEEKGWDFADEQFAEDNPFFSFHKTVTFDDNTLYIKFDYTAKQDHIAADQIDKYLTARDNLRGEAYFGIIKYADKKASDNATPFIDYEITALHIIIALYVFGLGFIVISWRLESRERPIFNDSEYYPISLMKFMILSIGTMGIYEVYWCYRNWHGIKAKTNSDIMPIARGIFAIIWFYPLFNALKKDSETRFDKNKVLFPLIAMVFAAVYVVVSYATSFSNHVIWTILSLLTAFLFVPLVTYVNSLNQQAESAIKYNSKWRIRQVLALVLCIPLLTYVLAIETPFLPGDAVRTESQILDSDLKFMYRKQVLPANETIHYFYSDAVFSIRDDGNGFTDQRAFSFWQDDNDGFELETASYDQIKNIEVEYGEDAETNTIITIKRQDSSEFMLFVSTVDGGDKLFFNKLNSLWKKHK